MYFKVYLTNVFYYYFFFQMHLSTLYNYTAFTIIVCRRTTSNVSPTTTPPHVATPAPYVRSAFPLYLLPCNPHLPQFEYLYSNTMVR